MKYGFSRRHKNTNGVLVKYLYIHIIYKMEQVVSRNDAKTIKAKSIHVQDMKT